MDIIKGKVKSAKKVVIYGPEGIGKSSLAAQFPEPLFSDTEGSTKELDVARFEKPSSWAMLGQQADYVIANRPCKTYIIDTIDWAESMCLNALCDAHGKKGIEDFGYGNGWTYEKEDFGRYLNKLEMVVAAGINVVLVAHAVLRKFEQPDELGAYDRWELKLGKKTTNWIAPMIKEWADMVLFANYKTLSVAVDKDGKKHKAQGGRRVIYTSHHPCWDAKNRYGLPEEIPMEYSYIKHIIEPDSSAVSGVPETPKSVEAPVETVAEKPVEQPEFPDASGIPKALADLMNASGITEEQIRRAVSEKGYFPADMPVKDYPPEFINGVLIGAWEQVKAIIDDAYPFF